MSDCRPFEWTPLAAGDPIPGDPYLVERAGRDYRRIAHAIETAASRLRTIASDVSMQSDAVAQIRERAEDLANKVGRSHDRYEAIGVALIGYAGVLTEAQASSLKALRMAQDANANLILARYGADDAQRRIDAVALDVHAHSDLLDAQRRQQAATAELAVAREILNRAVQHRDDAAEAARRVIDAAKHQDGLNDSRWDNIKAATISTLKSVASMVDKIAVWTGVLALALAWVPFLGEFLAAVALVAAIASLALKVTLKALGEGSWREIAIAAIGVALFGVGKVAVGNSELAALGARGSARLTAGQIAAEAPEIRAAAGLPASGNPIQTIDSLLGAGNEIGRRSALSAAAQTQETAAGAAGQGTLGIARGVVDGVVEDLKNIRQWDVMNPIDQIRRETPLHLLSFLGERSVAADAIALERLHPALQADPDVAVQLVRHEFATQDIVMIWGSGTGLLERDVRGLFDSEVRPYEALQLNESRP